MAEFRIRHPLVLLSLALLILNDHFFKGSVVSGVITGKLSDFAGLFFFPFFLADCLRLSTLRVFHMLAAFTALAFIALKTSPLFLQIFLRAYESIGFKAQVIQDPTDLWAIVVLPLATLIERTRISENLQHGDQHEF